jgi:hypothetical protein
LECGKTFSTKRRDALYDTATCRQRANRRRKQILKEAEEVVSTIRRLERMKLERSDLQAELHQALQLITGAICDKTGVTDSAITIKA